MLQRHEPFQAAKHTNGRGEEHQNSWADTRPTWLQSAQRHANDARGRNHDNSNGRAICKANANGVGAAIHARLRV